MGSWTPELEADVANLTPREFEAKHPGLFTPAAIHIRRRVLRDAGVNVVESPIGRKPDDVITHIPVLPDEPSDDELWEAYDKMYDVVLKHDEAKASSDVQIQIDTDRPFGVVFMSDFHLGSKGVDHRSLREDIDLIATCPTLKIYLGGDGIDNFVLQGLANVHRDTSLVPLGLQFTLFRSLVRRMQPNLLAVGTGNHDRWTDKVAGIDAYLHALANIPVLHTGEDSYLTLMVGSQEYVIYRKHRPTRSSQYNDGHGVQHMFRFGTKAFDAGVMEHHHTPHISSFWAHGEMRWAIRTGSYKIRDSHAREWGFHHGGIGTPVLVFHPHRKEIIPFMSLTGAIEFLEVQ